MNHPRIQQLFEFLQKSPNDAFTLYSIAYEYLRVGENEQALEYFFRLKQLHPDYLGTYYHLGECLERLGRTAEAITIYESGIQEGQAQRDQHAVGELKRALLTAQGLDDDEEDW